MKKIAAILLVSLLGFLGCSGSDDTTSTTSTTVGEANPVAPFGIIDTLDPMYEWTSVPGATKYRLLVQDEDDTVKVDEWYTAEESGCASEKVSCTVHPGIVTIGENKWEVQACATQDCGAWSEPLNYDVKPTPVSTETRFTINGDGTVTDNNTQLMWTYDPGAVGTTTWAGALNFCNDLVLPDSGYSDWRLPTIYELYPILVFHGNPEQHIYYWTSTEVWGNEDPSMTWVVYRDGPMKYKKFDVNDSAYVWPVRGGYH